MAGSEEIQAKRDLMTGIEAFGQANKELESLKYELRGKEAACYTSGGDPCIEKFDRLRLKYAMMNRERERDLEDCLNMCRGLLPRTLLGQELNKWQVRNAEEMKGFRDFVNCHVGCLEQGRLKIDRMKTDMKTVLQEEALP